MKDGDSIKSSDLNDNTSLGKSDQANLSMTGSLDKELYKNRKKLYQREKKKLAEQLLTTLNDPTVLVLADWLKVRATLKAWYKVWCELRPGVLVLYKSQKTHKYGQWIGTVLLSICQVIERPSRKDGFCFKLFNPLEQNIWACRGPKGETFGAITMPLPLTYLMFRVGSPEAGSRWMQAIQLSLKCSKEMIKDAHKGDTIFTDEEEDNEPHFNDLIDDQNSSAEQEFHSSDSDATGVFDLAAFDKRQAAKAKKSVSAQEITFIPPEFRHVEMVIKSENHKFALEEGGQSEEVGEENKSLLWSLLKQVRPGMDLSKVVLPTFILEPRSFLEKLADYYFHCNILAQANAAAQPYDRMCLVLKWYLSGFYKKPDGLKKPYNPILGEFFRCAWDSTNTLGETSRTYFLAEQVSHHPPMSAFFAFNPQDAYEVTGVVLVRSKFYGNSVSAILEGQIKLRLLSRGEEYSISLPYAHCKGILLGNLTFELGGKVDIRCGQTGHTAELEFKLKPFLGGEMNLVNGKVRGERGETIASVVGHWDKTIELVQKKNGCRDILWQVKPSIAQQRLPRFVIPMNKQQPMESERLWCKVSEAIESSDQNLATIEKSRLEEKQRKDARRRLEENTKHEPTYFMMDEFTQEWRYKHEEALLLHGNNCLKTRIAVTEPGNLVSLDSVPPTPDAYTSVDGSATGIRSVNLMEQQRKILTLLENIKQNQNVSKPLICWRDALLVLLFAIVTQILIKLNLFRA